MGHIRDLFRRRYSPERKVCAPPYLALCTTLGHLVAMSVTRNTNSEVLTSMYAMLQGYAPIRQDYEDFYTRRMFYRIHVCPSASSTSCCLCILRVAAGWTFL